MEMIRKGFHFSFLFMLFLPALNEDILGVFWHIRGNREFHQCLLTENV